MPARTIWDILGQYTTPGGPVAPQGGYAGAVPTLPGWLGDLQELSRQTHWEAIDPANYGVPVPDWARTLAYNLYRPPRGAVGWPYPGFQDLAYDTTGIQRATGSPLLNWGLWGYGLTPDQPRQSALDYYTGPPPSPSPSPAPIPWQYDEPPIPGPLYPASGAGAY